MYIHILYHHIGCPVTAVEVGDTDNYAIFWKAICSTNGIIHKKVNDSKFLSLVGDAKWLNNVSKLYVRKCYIDLSDLFLNINIKSGLLLGTPGIGKSLFLRWFISQLVSQRSKRLCIRVTRRTTKNNFIDYWCD